MAAYSLSLLMRGNTNAFERAAQIQRETFPEDHALISVNRDAYLAVCDDCAGSGSTSKLCPSCMASGKCKACAGSGLIQAAEGGGNAACPSCKRSGVCPMCTGKQKIETLCPLCKGAGRIIRLSEKVRTNYISLLTNMVAICQENLDFSGLFVQAKNESDPATRIQLLQALLKRFAHRTDLAPVADLLEKEMKSRDAAAEVQRKQQEQEHEQQEFETLRNLRDSKDTAQALATLRAYLAAHPKSANRAEVQSLLDDLSARQSRKKTLWKIAYGTVALIGALLLIQLIKPLLFRKRRFVGTVKEIDKTQFSDPLSLTAIESKARVKTKTVNIPPED